MLLLKFPSIGDTWNTVLTGTYGTFDNCKWETWFNWVKSFPGECDLELSEIEAANRDVLYKKVFLKISQNSQENACARVSFLIKSQALDLQLH